MSKLLDRVGKKLEPNLVDSTKDFAMKDKLDTLKKDILYTLEKTSDKFGTSMVSAGYKVEGFLEYRLLEDEKGTYFIICVSNSVDYLRPSTFKGIVDETDTSITFESQGGFYKLSWSD